MLDSAKKEEESALELHGRESRSSSVVAMRMEQQQNFGYQELQKKVSREFQRTQSILEDWMFAKVNKQFEFAREKLTSELLSAGRITAEQAEQILVKYKPDRIEAQDNAAVVSKLPFPVLSPDVPVPVVPNGM